MVLINIKNYDVPEGFSKSDEISSCEWNVKALFHLIKWNLGMIIARLIFGLTKQTIYSVVRISSFVYKQL